MPRYNANGVGRDTKKRVSGQGGAKGSKASADSQFRGFVKHPKTREIKEEFSLYLPGHDAFHADVGSLFFDGFKVTTQWDEDSDCLRCTAFSNDASRSDCGLALTVWAPDYNEAYALVTFFIYAKGMGSLSNDFFVAPDEKVKRTFWD